MRKLEKITVAIYSGVIPSTTFIDRLVEGIAKEGIHVVLFGTQHQSVRYPNRKVRQIGNQKGLVGVFQGLVRVARLRILEPDRYRVLRRHIGMGLLASRKAFRLWQRYSPVVLHLPDLFHVQWAKAAGEWLFLKEKFGVKMVLSLRGTHITYSPLADPELAAMYRTVFPHYDAFHAVSTTIANQSLSYGVAPSKLVTIYSGIRVSPQLADRGVFLENGELRILAVGRMHWVKGYHYLLDALYHLKEHRIPFAVTLIAEGEMSEEILFQLHDLQLTDEVKWISGMPHPEVLSEMRRQDVLVLSSVEEGIANVVLEAMNEGLPVISTDCGGMREVIVNEENGFLVPVRKPIALAEALIRYSQLPKDRINAIRDRARQTIQQRYDAVMAMQSFSSLYRSLI